MQKTKKISYIKKPFARKSLIGLPLAAAALLCCVCCVVISIRMQGQGDINMAAWGFSSLLFSVFGMWYGIISFMEKEMNYILARIAIAICGVLLVFWISMLIVGLLG